MNGLSSAMIGIFNFSKLSFSKLSFSKRSLFLILSLSLVSGCANIKHASKSSVSLSSFVGLSELPDWYLNSRYAYLDSLWVENDFGQKLHYRDTGEGPVVVLLHNEMTSLHTWEAWIETLRADFRVIALDLPGSGLTGPTHCVGNFADTCPDNLSIEYLEHTLKYFLEDMGLRRVSIVGSGLGGYLGARYALDHPQNVDRLILLGPSGLQQEPPGELSYLTTTSYLGRFVQPTPVITSILRSFYARPDSNLGAIKRNADLAQAPGAHASNTVQLEIVKDLMTLGTTTDFSALDNATLVLWGQQDRWGDPSQADKWEQMLPNATKVTYPALGRMLNEEQPEITVADARAFLQDEPLPSIEGLGTEGTFTLDDMASEFDRASLFEGSPESGEEQMLDDAEMVDEP